jgi:hypothetical protein
MLLTNWHLSLKAKKRKKKKRFNIFRKSDNMLMGFIDADSESDAIFSANTFFSELWPVVTVFQDKKLN